MQSPRGGASLSIPLSSFARQPPGFDPLIPSDRLCRMQRYAAVKKSVHDHDGSVLCSCRDAATARRIADALNAVEDVRRLGPGSLLIRPHHMKDAQVEWPAARLLDKPSPRKKWLRENRTGFDDYNKRIAKSGLFTELQPSPDARKLRPAVKSPARLRGRVKKD